MPRRALLHRGREPGDRPDVRDAGGDRDRSDRCARLAAAGLGRRHDGADGEGVDRRPERRSRDADLGPRWRGGLRRAGLYGADVPLLAGGQVTDRYTAAVNQLGSAETQVRLGGIYALERIARDSARDRSTIIEILAALVRETSNASNRSARLAEIHAALTVLSRLPGSGDKRDIDLRGTQLGGVRVPGLALRGAALDGADLRGAHLPDADLRDATLHYAKADGINLAGGRLADAKGTDAQLPGSVLEGADLARTQFPSANLTGCRMAGVDLSDANLTQASLAGALLTRGQDGRPVRAARAVFESTVLAKATLEGVDLSTAGFRDTDAAERARQHQAALNDWGLRT